MNHIASYFLFFMTTTAPLLVSCAHTKNSHTENDSLAAAVPVIVLDASSNMEVHFLFENTTTEPVKYILALGGKEVGHLKFSLYRDGNLVPTHGSDLWGIDVHPRSIRVLDPGQSIFHTWSLRSFYKNLKTGRYELRVTYRVKEGTVWVTEYGLTPMTIEQKLYVEIK